MPDFKISIYPEYSTTLSRAFVVFFSISTSIIFLTAPETPLYNNPSEVAVLPIEMIGILTFPACGIPRQDSLSRMRTTALSVLQQTSFCGCAAYSSFKLHHAKRQAVILQMFRYNGDKGILTFPDCGIPRQDSLSRMRTTALSVLQQTSLCGCAAYSSFKLHHAKSTPDGVLFAWWR